jgi:hypothetical protein
MTDRQPATPDQPGFVRGNENLDELLADPQLAADVATRTPTPRSRTGSTR